MDWLSFREPVNAWTHCAGLLLALLTTLVLWYLSRGSFVKRVGLMVFGLSLVACYAGSTLYHGVRLPPEQVEWFATVDYIGIYLLIAGTATPPALVVLRGRWRWGLLGLVWALAAGGIGWRLSPVEMSRSLSTGLYIGMGWAVFLFCFELARHLPPRSLWPAVLGGLLYSGGAVLNYLHWPALWPGAFSAHELYHLFVLAGSACHVWLMVKVVVPFERRTPGEVVWGNGQAEGWLGGPRAAHGETLTVS